MILGDKPLISRVILSHGLLHFRDLQMIQEVLLKDREDLLYSCHECHEASPLF
jgi:hypothetical protein